MAAASQTGTYLFTGGYVATMDDSLGDFEHGAVLVENGVIKAVGKAGDFSAEGVQVIDTTNGVVIPGLIDTHRHTSLSLLRGIAADQSLIRFLSNCYLRWLPATSPEDIYMGSFSSALEAIDSGVTTVLDCAETVRSTQHAESNLQALNDSGIRAFYCYGMSNDSYDGAKEGKDGWAARLAHVNELYESRLSTDDSLVRVGLQTSHPGTVPFDYTEREIKFAQERGMLCCSHTGPFMNTRMHNCLSELAERGLMLPGHVYIHCTNLNHREMELIAKSGGKVSIATETEMQMGMGLPPVRACIEHGIKPTLSVDTSSIVAPDLLSQMRLALQLQRCLDHDAAHKLRQVPIEVELTARDALSWVTRNAAEAVGMANQIGTLTPGKRADVTFISFKRFITEPAFPLGVAVLHSTPADVDTVMVDGVVRKHSGQLIGHDLGKVRARSRVSLERTKANLSNFRNEMTTDELHEFLQEGERSTRANFARAYQSSSPQ